MSRIPFERARRQVHLRILSEFPMAPMYRVTRCRYPAGLDCDYHGTGEGYHAIVTLSGRMVFRERGGKACLCERGTVTAIPSECVLRWHSEKDTELVHFHHNGFELEPHGAMAHLFGALQSRLATVVVGSEHIEAFEQRLALAEFSTARDTALSVAGLTVFLAALEASRSSSTDSSGVPGRSSLARCLNFIEGNLRTPMTLAELAEHSCVCESRLLQLFKEKVGVSPQQYIASRKTDVAERLLADGDLSVGAVAEYLGFTSISYFSRFIKRRTGRTPKEFQ